MREGRLSGSGPPTPEVISAFEHEFNVSLPSEYLELLMYSNGGHPELDSIAPMGRTDIAEWAINHFLYLNEDRNGPESLWRPQRNGGQSWARSRYLLRPMEAEIPLSSIWSHACQGRRLPD